MDYMVQGVAKGWTGLSDLNKKRSHGQRSLWATVHRLTKAQT